jgi:hypothetical protein
MDKKKKIVSGIIGIGCVALIGYGVYSYNTNKDKEVATSTQILVSDSTEQSDTEKVVDDTIYNDEAQSLWDANKDNLICDESTFIEKYIAYRNQGLTQSEAFQSLDNEYNKGNQIEEDGNGEVVAPVDDPMNSAINSEDDPTTSTTTPSTPSTNTTTEDTANYTVDKMDDKILYALQQVNLRQGPDATDFEKVGSLSYGDAVTVTGVVKVYNEKQVLWYQLDTGEFVSGAYLAESLPAKQEASTSSNTQQSNNSSEQSSSQQSSNNNSSESSGSSSQASNSSASESVNNFFNNQAGSLDGVKFGGQATTEGSGASTTVKLQ